MLTRREYRAMLEELLDELPERFFDGLNLGVVISDEEKAHPRSRAEDELLILGEYQQNGYLGRQIVLYWPAFRELYGHLPRREARRELRAVLRHEFRHHLETRAGEDALIREDLDELRDYLGEGRKTVRVEKCRGRVYNSSVTKHTKTNGGRNQ